MGANSQRQRRSAADLTRVIRELQRAMAGLAIRQIPGDPLPCFCLDFVPHCIVHDQWCEDARLALSGSAAVGQRGKPDGSVVAIETGSLTKLRVVTDIDRHA